MQTAERNLECERAFSGGVRSSLAPSPDVIYGRLNDPRHLSFVQTARIGFLSKQRMGEKGERWGGRSGENRRGDGGLGGGGLANRRGCEGGGLRRVLGKGKVQVEGVGRQNQREAETRVKEDDRNINIKHSRKKRK